MAIELSIAKSLADMLTGFFGAAATNRKKFFETHIESLQQRLESSHSEYMTGFKEVRRLLISSDEPTEEIIEFLVNRRLDGLAHRDLAKALATELGSKRPPMTTGMTWSLVRAYAESINSYFHASGEVGVYSWYFDYLGNVRDMKRLAIGANVWRDPSIQGNPQAELLGGVESILESRLPEAYRKVAESYAALRSHLT